MSRRPLDPGVPETTEAAPETTEAAPETTEAAPETTEAAPETTEAALETTEAAPGTTEAAPETNGEAGEAGGETAGAPEAPPGTQGAGPGSGTVVESPARNGGEGARSRGTRTRPGILERIRRWWIRVQARPAFQRWASAFPLTRPVALHRTQRVFDLCSGFVYSQTVLALMRLEILQDLLDGPLTEEEVAERTGLPLRSARRILEAGSAVDVLRHESGAYALSTLGAPLATQPAFRSLLEHNALFYEELVDPVALLRRGRGTELPTYWPYSETQKPSDLPEDQVAAYSRFMADSQPLVAQEILDAYDVRGHDRILDVGGGEGVFLGEVGARAPKLELHLFDLPAVAERGRRRLEGEGLGSRLTVTGGDFFRDPLPRGADLVTLVRILHDHDDAEVESLLGSVREALRPGGTLLVAEPMAGTPHAETVGAAYFGLYLLALGQGAPRSPSDLAELVRQAGFRDVRTPRARSPVFTSLLVARAG
jgi:demethylspheroidene O-methyltransferase